MKSKHELKNNAPKAKSKKPFWHIISNKELVKQANELEKSVVSGTERFVIRKWQKIREVRNQIIIWSSLLVTVFLALGLQIFFSQRGYRSLTMVGGGTYREGVVGKIDSLNPLYAMTESEKSASYLMFSRLLSYDSTGSLKNDLAKSLTVSGDGTTYSVTIRDDVYWHDGEKLTAKDIKFTIDLIQSATVKSSLGSMWRGVKVQQVGDYSIEFILPAPYGPFRPALTFSVLPEHILGQVDLANLREVDFSSAPVGSGPLRFQSLRNVTISGGYKQVLHLTVNNSYYQPPSRLNRFELHAFASQADLRQSINDGEINAGANVALSDIEDQSKWTVQDLVLQNGVFAFFNNDSESLKNANVRKALRSSLNLAAIRNQFNSVNGNHRALDLPILPEQLGDYKPEISKWFDLESATKTLQAQGYKLNNGKWQDNSGQNLKLDVVAVKDSGYVQLAELLTEAWRDFGIEIDLNMVDLNDQNIDFVRNFLQPRYYDVLIYEIALGSDPDQFAYWHSSQKFANGLNQANYSDSVSDALLSTARASNDLDLRQAKYKNFVQRWLSDAPAVALVRSNFRYALANNTQAGPSSSVLANPQTRYSALSDFLVSQRLVYTTP